MLIREYAKVGRKQYARRDRAVPQGTANKKGTPRLLAQAWGWVEFRQIALRRQRQYLLDGSGGDAGESRSDKQFGVTQ